MKTSYTKKSYPPCSCETFEKYSFFELIDSLIKDECQSNDHPIHRFCTLIIESGFPVILGVQGLKEKEFSEEIPSEDHQVSHVMPVIGHTLNTDRWVESRCGYRTYHIKKKYYTASEWCDHFIINDDNYGMYITLPTDLVRLSQLENSTRLPDPDISQPDENEKPPDFSIVNQKIYVAYAVGFIPNTINIQGFEAEQKVVQVLKPLLEKIKENPPTSEMPKWFHRMYNLCVEKEHFVCRTLLSTKVRYIDYIRWILQSKYPEESFWINHLDTTFEKFPEYLWISEISHTHLYTGNQTKLGDAIVPATVCTDILRERVDLLDNLKLLLFWGPGFICFEKESFWDSWPIHSHVPLIRNSPPSPDLKTYNPVRNRYPEHS